MIDDHDRDELTAEDLACAGLKRVGDDDWSVFTVAERHAALIAAATEMEALKRRERRQDQRREVAREIAVLKTMQQKGLPIRCAVVDGVAVEFGRPEPEPAANVTELDQWISKHVRPA